MKSWWDFGEDTGLNGSTVDINSIECGFCNQKNGYQTLDHKVKKNSSTGKALTYNILQCENCGNYTFLFWSSNAHGGRFGRYDYRTLPYPLSQVRAPDHWPADVQRYWKQAHGSIIANNWDAAALMARSALQCVMREQGAKGKNLYQEIEDLKTRGQLPEIMKDFAEEVRELGNDSAHPKVGMEETTEKDAKDVVEFLDIVLDYLYNLPKKINDYRSRRNGV